MTKCGRVKRLDSSYNASPLDLFVTGRAEEMAMKGRW